MKALLLAAGLGTRLAPLTQWLPKVLMPVRGVPLLAYWLHALRDAGVEAVLINVHHHARLVENYLRRHAREFDPAIVHEAELLNTGGTVLGNRAFFGGEPGMVIHADNLCLAPLGALRAAHAGRPQVAVMTMMTFHTAQPQSCGIVETDPRGLVVAFHEKVRTPPGALANAAIYILEPEVIAYMAALGTSRIDFSTEVIPAFLGRIHTHHNAVYHLDIGTLASLESAQEHPLPDAAWLARYTLVDRTLPLAAQVERLGERLGR